MYGALIIFFFETNLGANLIAVEHEKSIDSLYDVAELGGKMLFPQIDPSWFLFMASKVPIYHMFAKMVRILKSKALSLNNAGYL